MGSVDLKNAAYFKKQEILEVYNSWLVFEGLLGYEFGFYRGNYRFYQIKGSKKVVLEENPGIHALALSVCTCLRRDPFVMGNAINNGFNRVLKRETVSYENLETYLGMPLYESIGMHLLSFMCKLPSDAEEIMEGSSSVLLKKPPYAMIVFSLGVHKQITAWKVVIMIDKIGPDGRCYKYNQEFNSNGNIRRF